jgi:hypothetical protein
MEEPMTTAEVLDWWDRAAPLPLTSVPTLRKPVEVHRLLAGGVIEVHADPVGSYRLILVRREGAGQEEEVRVVPLH